MMDEENVRVDNLITELDAMRRERDDALAKAAEAVRLREEDGAQLLAVESDLRKMTARADNLGIEMQGWKAKAERAEAECERLRELCGRADDLIQMLRGDEGYVERSYCDDLQARLRGEAT